jgi:hypothetical protein
MGIGEYRGDGCRDDPHRLLMIACAQGEPTPLREPLHNSASLPGTRRRYPRPPFSDKSVRTRTHSRLALSTNTTTRSNHDLFIPYDTGHDMLLRDKSSAARKMPYLSDAERQDDNGHEIVMNWNEI